MGLTLVTPAASAPVTLAEARAFCKREAADTSDDTRIQLLLNAAITRVEDETGRALGSQTWLLALDEFADAIELPCAPVIGIESSCNCGCFPRTLVEAHTSGCRILKEGSSHEALCRIGLVDGIHAGLHR